MAKPARGARLRRPRRRGRRADRRKHTEADPAAILSVIGHITGAELRRHAGAVEIANGFLNRFLVIACQRVRLLPEGGERDPVAGSGLERRLATAIAAASGAGRVRLGPRARELWHEAYERLATPVPGISGALDARAEAHAIRLALIYALVDGTGEIAATHLESALALREYSSRSVGWAFDESAGDPLAAEIWTAIRHAASDGLTRTQIRDLCHRNQSGARIDGALAALRSAGRITRDGSYRWPPSGALERRRLARGRGLEPPSGLPALAPVDPPQVGYPRDPFRRSVVRLPRCQVRASSRCRAGAPLNTLMLEGGADIRFIQQMLDHAELTTTQIYTQVSLRKLAAIHAATHPGARNEWHRSLASEAEGEGAGEGAGERLQALDAEAIEAQRRRRERAPLDSGSPPSYRSAMHSLLELTIVYEDAGDGWITASVAEVPGANSQGKTRAEARENVIDALHEILAYRFGEHTLSEPAPDSESLHLQLA